MRKRAFFVVGSEGSGTYMLAEAFASVGCTYCDKDDVEEFLNDNQPDNLVLRRSLPHAGKFPLIGNIHSELMSRGYKVKVFVIVRDQYATLRSVAKRKYLETFDPKHFDVAMNIIGNMFMQFDCRLVTYSSFVESAPLRRMFFANLDFDEPDMEFYNGNSRYFK